MCAKRTMWVLTLGVVAAAGTADAQQRVPYYCQDVRKAPAQCKKYYESVSRNGEIREEPKPGSRQDSRGTADPERDRAAERARDTLFSEGRERLVEALPKTPTGKAIKKGFEYADAVDNPAGYAVGKAVDKGLELKLGPELAGKIGKRFINPGKTFLDIITEPVPNPKGYRDGQSRRPGNEHAAGLAYEALEKGYCLERHRLVPSGPTIRAGSPGGVPAPRPVPSRAPDSCASVSELTDYVNQYQREFEQIAAQERLAWERQPWYQPFDSRDLDNLIRYAEQLMNDPSLPPDARAQFADVLSQMRSERKRQGGFVDR